MAVLTPESAPLPAGYVGEWMGTTPAGTIRFSVFEGDTVSSITLTQGATDAATYRRSAHLTCGVRDGRQSARVRTFVLGALRARVSEIAVPAILIGARLIFQPFI